MLKRIIAPFLFALCLATLYADRLPIAKAQDTIITSTVRIWGSWQPILGCSGCNPDGAWSGLGATNGDDVSIVKASLKGGDTIQVLGLGGSVGSGEDRISCRTGSRQTSNIPQQVPLLQFLDSAGRVVALPGGGYNGTHALRAMDLQRQAYTVPALAVSIWASWPDDSYHDNIDLCFFTLEHVVAAEDGQQQSVSSSSSISSVPSPRFRRQSSSLSLSPRRHRYLYYSSSSSVSSSESSESSMATEEETGTSATLTATGATTVDEESSSSLSESSESSSSSVIRVRQRSSTPKKEESLISNRNTRLLCRVKRNLLETEPTLMRIERTVRRLEDNLQIPYQTIINFWNDDSNCAGLGLSDPVYTPASPEQSEAPTEVTPVATQQSYADSKKTDSTPATSASEVTQRTAERRAARQSTANVTPTTSSTKTALQDEDTKIRVLCRAQKRAMADKDPELAIANTARVLAKRWNSNVDTLIAALEHDELCEATSLAALAGTEEGNGNAPEGNESGWFEDVLSMNTVMLVITGLVVAALALLVVLFIIFLFVGEQEQDGT